MKMEQLDPILNFLYSLKMNLYFVHSHAHMLKEKEKARDAICIINFNRYLVHI